MDDDGKRLLKERFIYYTAAMGIVAQLTSQMAELNGYNKSLCGIAIGAYLVSTAATLWAGTPTRVIEENSWKIRVFKTVFYSTCILSPYAAVSLLLPKTFAWYLLAMIPFICLIIALFNFYDILRLVCQNVATRWNMSTPNGQVLPTSVDQAPRIEQNLEGSGPSSSRLPWLPATAPTDDSQELPNLNEWTSIPF